MFFESKKFAIENQTQETGIKMLIAKQIFQGLTIAHTQVKAYRYIRKKYYMKFDKLLFIHFMNSKNNKISVTHSLNLTLV